jgi:hypothetical protein
MPPRRWRLGRREQLTPPLKLILELGRHQAWRERPELEGMADAYFFNRLFEPLWAEHGTGVLAEWIAMHPGRRPWAWWRWDAREPRRVVEGAELLVPRQAPTDYEWLWRGALGVPSFLQCRPRSCVSLPRVESQAAYLGRLKLFLGAERKRLTPDAFAPDEINPFLTYEGELEELRAEGERRRAEEHRRRAGAPLDLAQQGNGHAASRGGERS